MFLPRTPVIALFLLFFLTQAVGALGLLSWSTDADWATGNFSNATTVSGILQVNRSFYREYEPANGMVAWWHFNEGAGTTASDVSGNGNGGDLGNASDGTAPKRVPGLFGYGLNFSGLQFVNVSASSSLNITGSITVEAWASLNSTQGSFTGSDSYSTILKKDGAYYLLGYTNKTGGQRAGFWIYLGGGIWMGAASADDLRGTGWHHLAGTYDGSAVRFYIDGALKATNLASGQIAATNSSNLYIGSYNGTVEFFNGTIDEIRVLNRSLGPDEVALDYAGYFRSASYVSGAIAAFNRTILSVTPLINKVEYNWNGIVNATSLTLEISVNNGTTWRLAANNLTLNTSADNGTRLSFRVNFTTNDTRLSAALISLSLTAVTQGLPPVVSQLQAGYSQAGPAGITFNCSATDDSGLYSISLWHNLTGTWHQNQTTLVTGTSNATSFAVNGTSGNFIWNCMAADSSGNTAFGGGNYTISLAQATPSLSLAFYPSASAISVQQGSNGTVTATVRNNGNGPAVNVSLSFSSNVACCSFSYTPASVDIPQLASRNFTVTVLASASSSAAPFSAVVTAKSQDGGAVASSPLTINVLLGGTATPTTIPTRTSTPAPSPTPDLKEKAVEALAEANATIQSVDILIAAAEREKKDVREAVSKLAEARGLMKRANSLMSAEDKDYAAAQKSAQDATARAKDALAAIPEKGKYSLPDYLVVIPILGLVGLIGFIIYSTVFVPKKRPPPLQPPYQFYYRNYPYYQYPPQGGQQQQPSRRP